jgi:hypothetical protein
MSSGKSRKVRGRRSASKNFKLVTVPHASPDVRKLGRAFLALALHGSELHAEATTKETNDGAA